MNFGSLLKSVIFHVAIIVVMTIGVVFTPARDIVLPPPMTVEFATVAELTQTTTPVEKPPVKKPEEEKPPQKTEEPPKPPPAATNKSEEPAPPPVEKPKEKEPAPPPEQEAEVKPAPKPEPVKEEKPKEEPKPETNKKAAEKQPETEKPKEPETPKEEPKPAEPQRDFGSVLKNLADTQPQPEPVTENIADKVLAEMGQNAPLGSQMTVSELDALRRQLESCWNVPIGARDAQNMVVDVNIIVGPDKVVKQASIVEKARYNNDTFFRAMADSAIRAVYAPAC